MAIIEFYCCDCSHLFESEPDGTGYEQAPCPKCTLVCMTSEFEGKSSKKEEVKSRMVIVAEFAELPEAEKLFDALEDSGVEPQINSPDVGADDFFGGGSDLYGVLAPSDQAEVARQVIEALAEQEQDERGE